MKSAFAIFTILVAFPAFAGDLAKIEIDSEALGKKLPCNILLPEGYSESGDKGYPVVYLLHGYGGDFAEWERIGIVEEAKGLEAIIVMPEGNKSFYVNHAGTSKERWEDYITVDVVSHIDSAYRTLAVRESRAINGLSMGGYGAVTLGLKHPELFASVASHSGAVGILKSPLDGDIGKRINEIYGSVGSEARKLYEPLNLASKLAKHDRPHLYLDCGAQDFLLESNRAFVAALAKSEFPYEYHESQGKHDFAYWKANVRFALDRQLKALAEAAKQPRKIQAVPKPEGFDLAGKWSVVATLPDGNEVTNVTTFSKTESGYKGSSINEGGESDDFEVVAVSGNDVQIETDVPFGKIKVTLEFTDGKLVGKWTLNTTEGQELGGGYRAERVEK